MNNRKILLIIFNMLICSYSLVLAYQNISNYTLNYPRFATVNLIYDFGLKYIYYFIIILQLLVSVLIWFSSIKVVRQIVSFGIYFNTFFLLLYFSYFKFIYKGCVECNYLFKLFNESINVSFLLSLAVFVAYFSIYLRFFKNKAISS
jgi:hypothetical protein